jgi:hypothetical protein
MSTITTTVSITDKGVYSYKPNSVTVTEQNTTLTYALDDSSALIWEIVGLTNTDTKNQLSNESKAPSGNSISVLDANSKAETFDVTVVAQHRSQRERILRIDPAVHNVPT